MIRPRKSAAVALGFALSAAVGVPRYAAAQDAAASCSIEEGSPKEVATAYLRLNAASGAKDRAAKGKSLREAIKSASTGIEKGQNVPGRNYIMAKAFVLMLSDSIVPVMTTRGDLGLVGGAPTERVDMIVAIDSLLDTVEKAAPDCMSETDMWRQNKPWLDLLNSAIAALDRGQTDSAEALANRTLVLHTSNPYGYQILASIAARKNDSPRQMEMWQKAITAAGTDTTHNDVRRQAHYYLGNLYAEKAQAADTGAEKVRFAREAQKLYRAFLDEAPDSAADDRTVVRSNLGIVMSMAGDTAEIPKLYADLLANPDKYSAADYLAAGDMAARLNRSTDAVKLYESVIKKNPHDRKALFNLAASYYAEKAYTKMVPTVHQLVAIDPSHPDNWKLLGYAYAMMQPEEKDPAKKKLLTDSIVKYSTLGDSMTTDVVIEEFATRGATTSVEGTVQNLDPKATKTYQLKFEFMDKDGKVIATQDASVGPVAPNTAKAFKVEVDKPGVSWFRYAPVK